MHKKDFILEMSKKLHVRSNIVNEIIDSYFGKIAEELAKKGKLSIYGFGKFYITKYKGRKINIPTAKWGSCVSKDSIYIRLSSSKSFKNKIMSLQS